MTNRLLLYIFICFFVSCKRKVTTQKQNPTTASIKIKPFTLKVGNQVLVKGAYKDSLPYGEWWYYDFQGKVIRMCLFHPLPLLPTDTALSYYIRSYKDEKFDYSKVYTNGILERSTDLTEFYYTDKGKYNQTLFEIYCGRCHDLKEWTITPPLGKLAKNKQTIQRIREGYHQFPKGKKTRVWLEYENFSFLTEQEIEDIIEYTNEIP